MHTKSLKDLTHEHVFLGEDHARNERRTWLVVALTFAMMVAEIVAGSVYGSMALLADGWHMATHVAAIGIAAFAYRFARTHANDSRFSFGTGKIGDLAAFASALILALIALLIAYESAMRLFSPVSIRFGEATAVAAIGLAVNLLSAWLLFDKSNHDHSHHHQDRVGHHHHSHDEDRDLNLRAAYLHVLADALTSVLAIVALLMGRYMGWTWFDPVIGIVGALVIARWAAGLIRSSSATLLDTVPDVQLAKELRAKLETGTDRVIDLHLWRVGPGHQAVIISIVSDDPQTPAFYKHKLALVTGLSHVTVEVEACPDTHEKQAA
ncbi:MAG: CDF family Co(II)/Ni(II) efflux transporter DmeF [Xanthobacteraceae bacterium]|nr:CDF family Co(II)/Ni(II) efflux transporter DmeF [Xanthobacteraceae bacterium]